MFAVRRIEDFTKYADATNTISDTGSWETHDFAL